VQHGLVGLDRTGVPGPVSRGVEMSAPPPLANCATNAAPKPL